MLIVKNIQFVLLGLLLIFINSIHAETDTKRVTGKSSTIIQLEVQGVIGPAISDYIERSLQKAEDIQASAVLIRMDTPGGLDLSMRQMIKKIIASPVPIITYVAPGGARAASAGTYILYASHIAAMAPATNLGAATPVQIGGFGDLDEKQDKTSKEDDKQTPTHLSDPMTHKMVNDAAAYIRGLARMRGRNEEWAERAVREAVSLSAEEALKHNVIDILATDEADLLKQLHGYKLTISGREITLSTENTILENVRPDWRSEFLAVITNPSIAYILLMIGIYGLIFEFSNPGSVVPGTLGAICLLLALYALQLLPINYAGIALILLGIALMIAESFVPSIGVLGFGGVAAFVIGSIILMDTDVPGFGIHLGVIAGFALSSVAFFIVVLGLLLKSRQSPVVCGKEEMLGSVGNVLEDFNGNGMVRIHSENWQAISKQPLHKNQQVTVTAINGLLLTVSPLNKP